MQKKVILARLLAVSGLKPQHIIQGIITRPLTSIETKSEGFWGFRKYVGISKELQTQLGIEKPGDFIVTIPLADGTIDLYILSQMSPDSYMKGPVEDGFIPRAGTGLHVNSGIFTRQQALEITGKNPIGLHSISIPDFRPDLINTERLIGITNFNDLQNKLIATSLIFRNLELGYPERLKQKWKSEQKALEQINDKNYPLLVVPNVIAKLLGLKMSESKNQPLGLSPTITSGGICTITIGRKSPFKAFLVGALDAFSVGEEIGKKLGFEIGNKYLLNITVSGLHLDITKTE